LRNLRPQLGQYWFAPDVGQDAKVDATRYERVYVQRTIRSRRERLASDLEIAEAARETVEGEGEMMGRDILTVLGIFAAL
jgi:hypothetical protein